MAEHGTNAGYHAHRRRGEDACRSCKDAHTAYVGRDGYGRARNRALSRLARRHLGEFAALLAEERGRTGQVVATGRAGAESDARMAAPIQRGPVRGVTHG